MSVASEIASPLLCKITDCLVLIIIPSFTHFLQFDCAPALWRLYRSTAGRTFGRPQIQICFHPLFSNFITEKPYFQLQLGCVFEPLNVNCFTFVPSASMVQI
jgi:hypothetical protein